MGALGPVCEAEKGKQSPPVEETATSLAVLGIRSDAAAESQFARFIDLEVSESARTEALHVLIPRLDRLEAATLLRWCLGSYTGAVRQRALYLLRSLGFHMSDPAWISNVADGLSLSMVVDLGASRLSLRHTHSDGRQLEIRPHRDLEGEWHTWLRLTEPSLDPNLLVAEASRSHGHGQRVPTWHSAFDTRVAVVGSDPLALLARLDGAARQDLLTLVTEHAGTIERRVLTVRINPSDDVGTLGALAEFLTGLARRLVRPVELPDELLARVYSTSGLSRVRRQSLRLLIEAFPSHPMVSDAVLRLCGDPDPYVQFEAAQNAVDVETGLEALHALAVDPATPESVGLSAAEALRPHLSLRAKQELGIALAELGGTRAWGGLDLLAEVAEPSLVAIVERVIGAQSDANTCELAAAVLGKVDSIEARLSLLRLFEHPEARVRAKAAEALGKVGTLSEAITLLRRKRAHNESRRVKQTIEAALTQLSERLEAEEAAVYAAMVARRAPYIIQFVLDREASLQIRLAALEFALLEVPERIMKHVAQWLREASLELPVEVVVMLAGHDNVPHALRDRALTVMCQDYPPTVLRPLLWAQVRSPRASARRLGMRGLGRIKDGEAIDYLLEVAGSQSADAATAVLALGDTERPELETALLSLIDRRELAVRIALAEALGVLGTLRSVPHLEGMASAFLADQRLVETARMAVTRIRLRSERQPRGALSVAVEPEAAAAQLSLAEGGELSPAESPSPQEPTKQQVIPDEK